MAKGDEVIVGNLRMQALTTLPIDSEILLIPRFS